MDGSFYVDRLDGVTSVWNSHLATGSLATTTAAPEGNCSDLVGPPVCNITACNFGHGCIIDFSTIDLHPWRVMEPWRVAVFGVGLAVTTLPGVMGNIFVIAIIISNKVMQNEINLFILNMAVADLISSMVLPPTFLVSNVFQAYLLGPWWCTYGGTVRLTLLLTSVFSISVISVDRLWGLMRPFHRQFRPCTIRAIMLGTWIVAAAVAFYPSLFSKYTKRQYRDFLDIMCEQDIARMRTYWWVICVFLVWMPGLILFACFVAIFIKLKHLNINQKKSGRTRFVPPATRARQRAVTLVFSMFVTFFVCWSPFLVYVLLYQNATTVHDNGRAWDDLYYASHFMMYMVPVINPILYALMHENFRRAATVTCPWLPSKVKYQAFQTGQGGRVRWSERGSSVQSAPSHPQSSLAATSQHRRPPPPLRRAHTLAEFPPGRRQSGATVAPAVSAAASRPKAAEDGARDRRLADDRLSEVTLIWNALMERQRQQPNMLSVRTLAAITEESESRRTSIMSVIDLGEVVSSAAPAAGSADHSGSDNTACMPD